MNLGSYSYQEISLRGKRKNFILSVKKTPKINFNVRLNVFCKTEQVKFFSLVPKTSEHNPRDRRILPVVTNKIHHLGLSVLPTSLLLHPKTFLSPH